MNILKRLHDNVTTAETLLNDVEERLEDLSSQILDERVLHARSRKEVSEDILILSERVASACDEMRELLGKKRIQTQRVRKTKE